MQLNSILFLHYFICYQHFNADDIDYLYSLDVNPTGQILKDCRNTELLGKKKTLQMLTEAQKKNRQEEKEKLNLFVQEVPCLLVRNNNVQSEIVLLFYGAYIIKETYI